MNFPACWIGRTGIVSSKRGWSLLNLNLYSPLSQGSSFVTTEIAFPGYWDNENFDTDGFYSDMSWPARKCELMSGSS